MNSMDPSPPKKDYGAALFCAAALGLLFAGLIFLYSHIWKEVQGSVHSGGWPRTRGVIVDGHHRLTKYGGRAWRVRYEYEVGGRKFRSKEAAFMLADNPTQSELPVGKTVLVFYNPKDPSKAVLRVGFRFRDLAGPLVLAGVLTYPFALIGMVIFGHIRGYLGYRW